MPLFMLWKWIGGEVRSVLCINIFPSLDPEARRESSELSDTEDTSSIWFLNSFVFSAFFKSKNFTIELDPPYAKY
jgi:hypothetical protein